MKTASTWQQEYKLAIKKTRELSEFLDHDIEHTHQPIFIPLPLLKRIKDAGPTSALWKQFIPDQKENSKNHEGFLDPIGDQHYVKAPQLIHRYKNRVLFLPTKVCPIQCRYCFRKNELHTDESQEWLSSDFSKTLNYLNEHPEVEEIIFSGGDPFILSDEKIAFFTSEFSKIKSIKFLRFHTRITSALPERVNDALIVLLDSLKKRFTVSVIVHHNHISELSDAAKDSLRKLAKTGVHLLSQSVLLKEVNDSATDLENLFKKLSQLGVTPYYLHHPDQVQGGMHFFLTIEQGRKIYAELKSRLSGWMLPRYVLDLPEGEGKTNVYNPETHEFSGQFFNKSGLLTPYNPLTTSAREA